jgi:trehalose-6-phosphate synthase
MTFILLRITNNIIKLAPFKRRSGRRECDMKINFTLIISIFLATGIVAIGFTLYQASHETDNMKKDLFDRSTHVYEEFDAVFHAYHQPKLADMDSAADILCRRFHLMGLAICGYNDSVLVTTPKITGILVDSHEDLRRALDRDSTLFRYYKDDNQHLFRYIRTLNSGSGVKRAMVIYISAGYVHQAIQELWFRNLIRWLIQALFVAFIMILILHWGILRPLKKMVLWMRSARSGNDEHLRQKFSSPLLGQLHTEATQLAKAMSEARAAAEEEVMLRTHGEAIWTPVRLQAEAKLRLKNRILIVVSNREPYMHIYNGKEIKCIVPASGMVTAMEPILKACGGLWVASGTGNADKAVVDAHDKIQVPPGDEKYTLRRVWLSEEEEKHFYYGFSNEGLWPLCHIAHTRPVFRTEDWQYYFQVNRKYADVILQEIKSEETPFILIQDYHFALLPAMIKESRPDARISIFWHIPWPNPESFGICPWQNDILLGMLGADLIGFHTQFHCNNFLSTINRTLESRVAWETFSVTIGDHTTRVSPFPISIDFTLKDFTSNGESHVDVAALLKNHGIQAKYFGIGVDRIDYTKGILERFKAVERFLEKYPEYQRTFTFVQIGAPSRTLIKNYSDLGDEVEKEAERINRKLQNHSWRPILLMNQHHSHEEIFPFYHSASLCMVTSIHDGMNLVAKEFVAARGNHTGVLILSRFTGAAQELTGSLIVNPYDIEEMADMIKTAIEMPEYEQKERMIQMRETILRHNVYSWAANLLKSMDIP